jgi:predicted amidophosphoribosyltransferase
VTFPRKMCYERWVSWLSGLWNALKLKLFGQLGVCSMCKGHAPEDSNVCERCWIDWNAW